MSYNLGDAIGYIKLNIQDFEQKYNEVHSKTESLEKIVDGLGNVFDVAGKMAAAAFTGISAAAVKATQSVVNVGSSFQAAMSQVAATMGMSSQEIENNTDAYVRLSDAAKQMGETTKYTATEAAQALNYLALAGYEVDESISLLPKILDTASAGGMDLAKASDMVTDAMSALGLSIEEADMFVDSLAKTSQRSNTSVSQLGDAILQIGGTAKSLSGGVTELNTALGILANNGIKAAEGGTALRQIILNLTAPTEKAQEYMDSLGFSAYDAAGNMKPLNETFAELDKIMSQFTTQQERDKVLTTIFDARQLKSARALLANYGDEWDNLYNEIEMADGAASQMAKTMETNLQGSLTIAKSALEAVQITVFDTFKDSFTKATNEGIKSINKLNETLKSPEMQQNLERIGQSIADVLLKLADFVANTAIPKFIEFAANLKEIAITLKSALAGLAAAIPLVTIGLVACNKTVQVFVSKMIAAKVATLATNAALLANPYTAVAVALGVLVSSVVGYVNQTNDAIEAARNQTTEFSKMKDAVEENIQALEDSKNAANELGSANTEQINQIRTLTNMLTDYANKTELTSDELANVQDIISQLNEVYPENTAYIEDGQIKAYEGLTQAVQDYTEQLYYAAQLEGQQQLNLQAYTSMKEAEENMDSYKNAIDEAKKAIDDFKKASDSYTAIPKEEISKAQEMGYSFRKYVTYKKELLEQDLKNAEEAYEKNNQVYEESKAIYEQGTKDILSLQIKAGVEIEGVYENQQEAYIASQQEYAEKSKEIEMELHKDEIAENKRLAEEKEKAYNQMWIDLEELDRKWQLRQIESEDDYMSQQKELLEANWNEYDDNWIKRYNKILVYEEQQNEKRIKEQEDFNKEQKQKQEEEKRAFENSIKERIEDLKYRNQIDESYTKEMMYKEMEVIRDSLDEQSDLWKDINKEIVLGRKELGDELSKKEVENAKKAFNTWQNELNDVVSDAEKAYSELESAKSKMQNSLISSVQLYETTTKRVFDKTKREFVDQEEKVLSSKGLKNQIKDLEKYEKTLDKLQQKGIGKNLMSKILGMDSEEGAEFAEMLNKMSSKELKNYSENYDKLIKKSEEMSSKYYDSQISKLEEDFTNKYKSVLKKVPEDVELVGQDTIQGFIDGLNSKSEESEGAIKTLFDNLIKDTKETLGVHSPSTVYYEIGENVMSGLVNGVSDNETKIIDTFSSLGTKTGQSFIDSFNIKFQSLMDSLSQTTFPIISMASNVSGSLKTPIIGSESSNKNANNNQNNNATYSSNNGLTKSDVVSAIKEAQPDGDIVLKVNESEFGRVARSSLNLIAKSSGNMGLKV